jgi:hypothetical protein
MSPAVLEAWNALMPYRLLFGLAFFVVLGVRDWRRNPADPRRAKEYLFLAFAALVAGAYGVAHDHVTATISRDYFLEAKDLKHDPLPFRLAVTWLAFRASYWVGLLAGAALLIANNPSPRRAQLPYRELARLCLLPLATAAVAAAVGGALFGLDVFSLREATRDYVASSGATRFLVVWGIHAGSYAGGAAGVVAAVVLAMRSRARGARPPAISRGAPAATSALPGASNDGRLV